MMLSRVADQRACSLCSIAVWLLRQVLRHPLPHHSRRRPFPLRAPASTSSAAQAARKRLLTPGGRMTDEERQRIRQMLSSLAPTGGGTTGNLSSTGSSSD